jgi:ribosomal protein L15
LLIIADFFPVWYAVTNSIEYYAGKEIADIRFADKADLAMHYNLFTDADTIAALAQFGNLGFTFETLYGDTYDLIVNALYPYSLRIIKIGYEEIISEDSDLAIGFAAYLSENFAAIEGTNDEFVAAEDMVTLPNQWILNNFVFSTLPDERIISLVITEGENVYELVSVEDDTNITTYSFITNPFTFDLSKAYEISFTASSIRASVTFTPVTDLAIVDLEGEPEESSFVVDKNTVLSQEQIPVLSSLKHNFLGWSYADGEMFDPATPITSDTVLFAVWEAKTFSLIIDRNDGGNVELVSSEILYGELSPVVPEAPSKDGYYFMDWRVLTLDEDGNEIELRLSPIFNWNEDTITSDITVVARYAPIVMVDFDDVSLVLFDGDEYDIVSEYFDIYEVDGLSFAIKYTKAITNGELEYIIRFMIDGMPESAVTYRENSLEGEAFELTDGNIFDSIELGEIIDGVYVDYLGDMNAFFTYALFDENDTLIQIVGMHIYIDEYVESSVTVSWTDPTDSENTVTKEIKVIAGGLLDFVEADENGIITINGVEYATDFASAGYDFVGLVGSDGKAYDFERKITADQEISFVFERRSYEITFEYDGITLDAAAEVLHGETINPDVMMSAGEEIWYIIWYELDIDGSFTAWYYLDEEGNRVEFDDDMPITKALTIYALVAETEELSIDDLSIAGEYTIDEEVQNKLVLEMDDNIILLDYLAALDFSKFEKDTIEAVIYVQLPASYNIAELLFNADSMFEYSYFATETEGLFGISILLGMGDPETHQYEMLGDGERLIDNTCTRATFVMRGIDADGFAVRDFRFDIAIGDYEEVEAEIVFVPDSITYDTITYNLNTVRGRTLDIANIFVSEDKSVKEEAEEIHGYTFDGWFTTLLFAKTEIDFETFLFEADKTVVTANYTKDYFDISYYDWDNTANDYATEESKEYQAEFEEKIISDDAPDASGRTGYHFAYWASRTLDDDGNYVYTEFNYLTELVLEDIDLYAVYVVDVYEVVFLVEGYEGVEEFSIGSASYGSYIQLPQPMIGLAYLGLFFDGWFVEGFETEGMTLTADQYLDGGVDGDTIYVMAAFKDNELTKTIEAETEGDEKGQYEAAYDEGEIVDGIFASVKNIYTEKDGTVTLIVTIDTTGDFDYDMVRLYFATMGSNYDSYSLKTISETEENLFVLTYVIADENGPVEGGIEEYLLLAYYDEDGNIVATKNFVVYFENYYNTLMEEMVALQNEFNIEASIYPLGTMARLENILAAIDTYESRLDEQAVEEFRNWLASPSVDFAGLYMAALREKYNAAVSSNLYDIAGIDGLAAFLADATNQLARANVSDMKAIYLDTLAKMDSVPTVAEKTLAAAKTAAINDLFLLLDEHKKEISRYAKGNDELLADMIESYGEILDGLGLTNVASLLFEFEIRQSIIKAAIGEYFETDEFIEAKAIEDEAYSLRTTLSSYFANMITEYDERAAQAIQDARDFITEKISEEPIREGYEEYTDIFESLKAEIIAKVADLDQIAKINALYDEYKAREAELIAEYDRLAAAIRAIEEARQFITEKISEESVPFDYEQYTDVFESLKAEIIAKAAYLDDITKINALYDEYKAREGELVAEYDRLAADAAKAAAADDKKALAISDATLEKIITDVLASRYGITLKAKHELLPFTFTLSAEEIETKLAKITNLLNTRVEAGVFADTIKVSIVDAFESYIENVLSIDNMDSNVVILLNQYKNELLDEINSVLDRSDRMDEAAAKAVDEMILSLGKKPTEESVKKARDAYKALNARQKTLVKELATLEEAENPSYLETLVLITFALAIGLTIITIVILLVIRKKRRDDDDDPRGPNGSGGGSDDDDSEKKTDSTNNDKNVNAKDEVSGPSKSAQNFFYNEDSLAESQRDEDLEDDDEDFEAEENDDEDEIEYEPEEDVEDDGEINEESQKEGSVISAFQGLNVKEKKSITQRMTEMSDFNKQAYGIIKNEIMSHKNVNNRMTKTTENFSFKRTPIIKLSLVGKTLRVYLGLDPNEYSKSIYHHKDVSAKKKYATVPLMMKVKNQRTVQRILELVTIVMDNNGISKKRKFEETDYYSELKNTALTPLGRMGYEHLIASKVNAEDADVLSDEVAFELVTVRVVKEKGEIRRERFSTSDINSNFMSGDTVDIATLQKKRLISKSANYLCITAEGTLEKTVNVVADEFEVTAAKMILLLGGSCTNLES